MIIELTVGVPASGKTTYAEKKVALSKGKFINLNRDDIRKTLFCVSPHEYSFTKEREELVTKTQIAAAEFALSKGKSVIISDTNLNPGYWGEWRNLAKKYNVQLVSTFFPLDLKTALKRNIQRENSVPEWVIRAMVEKFETNFPSQINYFVPKPYVRNESLDKAWIVDIDGTLAHMNGKRGPFQWDKVYVDDPDTEVIQLVKTLSNAGYCIILMSGRDEVCRELTEKWLKDHNVKYDYLHMRPNETYDPDTIIKENLFEEHVANNFNVVGVIDDRNVVVDMWRKKGLKVFQCELGDF